jgi:hypothetical protein
MQVLTAVIAMSASDDDVMAGPASRPGVRRGGFAAWTTPRNCCYDLSKKEAS